VSKHARRGPTGTQRAARRQQPLQLHMNVIATLIRILHLLVDWSS
jgi:hypothetical protein